MTTLMATATAAIVAALQASPAVAPQVARVRMRPLAAGTTTAVVVRPQAMEVDEAYLAGGIARWQGQCTVECYAKTTTQTAPDAAVDALISATYSRLMADPTLAGAVARIDPVSLAYDFDVDGEQTTCATLVFQIRLLPASTTTI